MGLRVNLGEFRFVKVGQVSEYTEQTLFPYLGKDIENMLNQGVGYLGDGMLRTVDPINIASPVSALSSPVHAEHCFPILTSAFADVVIYWRSRLVLINAKVGTYIGLGRVQRLHDVVEELCDPLRRINLLGATPWAEAVALHGVPAVTECFAYLPPLTVQPRKSNETTGLARVKLSEHLEFLADFHGRAQVRW